MDLEGSGTDIWGRVIKVDEVYANSKCGVQLPLNVVQGFKKSTRGTKRQEYL